MRFGGQWRAVEGYGRQDCSDTLAAFLFPADTTGRYFGEETGTFEARVVTP